MQQHEHQHAAPSKQSPPEGDGTSFTVSRVLTGVAIGAGVVGLGFMLAPHILPAMEVTSPELAEEAALMIHNSPSGMAGAINNSLALIPGIGSHLAEGGLFTAGASALTGISGVLMGEFLEARESDTHGVKWGTVIKYGALMTSALIALPAVLTMLGTGIIYSGMALSEANILTTEASNSIIANVAKTIGSVGGTYSHDMFGLDGLSAIIPHFFCCGAPLAPASLSLFMDGKKSRQAKEEAPEVAQPYSDGSITASIQTDAAPTPGQPCHAKLTLSHANGTPVSTDELAVVHTEKLHLLMSDSSLQDYHHIHPHPTGTPGEMEFTFTPRTANNYTAWADLTLAQDGKNHRLKIPVPSAAGREIPARIRPNNTAQVQGLHFDWKSEPLQQGKSSLVEVQVSDHLGRPVADLEPTMGAFAHLVGFSADGKSLIHCHPVGAEPTQAQERGGPSLQFHLEPQSSGATQFYLQVRRNGQELFVPFGQLIKAPAMVAARVQNGHPGTGWAMA